MNKLSRFLIKMVFIILILLLLLVLFKLTGLRVTLLMFFFVLVGKTWNYGSLRGDINSQLEDYYSLFNLKQNFSKDELQEAYDNEIDKLNNNLSTSIDNRLHLMGVFNTAFDTLNDSQTKNEYDDKYNLVLEEINASKLKSSELNNNIANYVDGLIKHNLSPFINFKLNSKDTLGLLFCIILDLVFILPFLK
jgi:hypothetical protein